MNSIVIHGINRGCISNCRVGTEVTGKIQVRFKIGITTTIKTMDRHSDNLEPVSFHLIHYILISSHCYVAKK